MRFRFDLLSILLTVLLGFGTHARAQSQACTGLCLQQVTCPGNGTTSISGTVYAPNSTDPLPNVTVYIPNAPVAAFTPGVSCPVVGAPPSGSPLIGTETDVNGNFTLVNAPVGANIPLVIVSGRWRRLLTISTVSQCQNNPLPASFAVMPQNHTQGDIPLIAIATGSVDQVECVLRKVGIQDSEFTDPGGGGRINLYTGSAVSSTGSGAGASIDAGTPTESALMNNASVLDSYDVLMLPCEGGQSNPARPAQQLANLIAFANAGGRIYASHYSYDWMFQNPPFDSVVNWKPGQGSLTAGTATVNTSFTAGQTLQTWLQEVGATTTPGQMTLDTLRIDTTGVNSPTQDWLDLNDPGAGNPSQQFVFDTPIAASGSGVNQCGRVLFNEYHVENGSSSPLQQFPTECNTGAMTPQEKLLEYMLFELTDEGGQPSLAPTSQDFGNQAIGFPSAAQIFTWTNNSSFTSQISAALASGDFTVVSNNCGSVAGGASCQIGVVFTPTALGARSGTLTVVSSGNTLTANLTGTGTPGYSLSGSTLAFGNVDVGDNSSQSLTLTSLASGPLPIPAFVTTGQYAVSTAACGTTLAAGATCPVKISFLPTATGPQNGTVGVNSTSPLYNGLTASFTGNGIDFTITLNPTSGNVVAGDGTSATATLTPLAGFANPVSISCNIAGANASSCVLPTSTVTPTAVTAVAISFSTTSQYTVIGYGSFGGPRYLWIVALLSCWLLWRTRRSARIVLRSGLMLGLLAAVGLSITGCSGKVPAQNPAYTAPGNYTITVSATDGFLIHSATYTLSVRAN